MGDLDTATLFALSVPRVHPVVLHGAGGGRARQRAPLRNLALEFATDIDGAPLVDALWAITCNDAAVHPGPVAAGNLARALDARYPLIGAYSVTYTMGGCVAWPTARSRSPTSTRRDAAGPGHRQHRRPQHPDHRGPAPGRHLPHGQHGDLEGLGPHLAAQRVERRVHAAAGDHLPLAAADSPAPAPSAPDGPPGPPGPPSTRAGHRPPLSRSTARRGHSAAARVASSTSVRVDRRPVDDRVAPLVERDPLGQQLGAVAVGVTGHRVHPEPQPRPVPGGS